MSKSHSIDLKETKKKKKHQSDISFTTLSVKDKAKLKTIMPKDPGIQTCFTKVKVKLYLILDESEPLKIDLEFYKIEILRPVGRILSAVGIEMVRIMDIMEVNSLNKAKIK